MSKFNFNKYAVSTSKTVPYKMVQLDPAPTLHVKPATENNKPYFNALLKRQRKTMKQQQAGALNANIIAQNREEDAELYANHVITGWENMVDADGKPVEYSAANCLDFLKALMADAPDFFDELRIFATNTLNFREDTIDGEATGKN